MNIIERPNVNRGRYDNIGDVLHPSGRLDKKAMCDPPNKQDFLSDNNMAEFQRDRVRETNKIAKELAYDIIHHTTGITTKKVKQINNKYSQTLRRTVDELSERHKIYLDSAVKRLQISDDSAHTTIDNVANEMFSDGQFNWGRLVTLYAFCGKIALNGAATSANQRDFIDKVADYTAEYVTETLSSRILHFGGWDSFVDFFPEPDNMENSIWKGLIYTVMGLGALATMVAVR